jgi:hypothetical protein
MEMCHNFFVSFMFRKNILYPPLLHTERIYADMNFTSLPFTARNSLLQVNACPQSVQWNILSVSYA